MKKELNVSVKNCTDVREGKRSAYLKRLSARLKKKFRRAYGMGDVVEFRDKNRIGLGPIGVICRINNESGDYAIDFGYGECSWFSDCEIRSSRFEQLTEMVPPTADVIESVEKVKNWMKKNRLTEGIFMGMEVRLP